MTQKYQITPEHQIELEKIKQKYIANAHRTDAMTEHDKAQMRVAMRGLYKNADLPYPGDEKVIFVASPLIAQFASGIAMQLIHGKKSGAASRAAVRTATRADSTADRAATIAVRAEIAATRAADRAAVSAATNADSVATRAVSAAVRATTNAATRAAEIAAVRADSTAEIAATRAADRAATRAVSAAVRATTNAAEIAAEIAAVRAATNADSAARSATRTATRADSAATNAENAARIAATNATNVARIAATNAEIAAVRAATNATNVARIAATNAEIAAVRAATNADSVATRATVSATNAARIVATNATNVARIAATNAAMRADSEKKGSLDIFLSAFIGLGRKYGKFALFSISFSWRYRARSALWPWYQVYGDFFKNVAKLPGEWNKWDPLNLDCLHGGVRFMTPDFTIISDRPEILKLDDLGRLHSENGPAVKWRDGMEQYYWHGIGIPDHWIQDKKSITPKMALTWENMEQRRAACEIVSWAAILKELDAKVIDKDFNPQIGELVEVEFPDMGKERFLRVLCGTGREFALCVTEFKHKTARECNAATYGWTKDQPIEHFLPVHRT